MNFLATSAASTVLRRVCWALGFVKIDVFPSNPSLCLNGSLPLSVQVNPPPPRSAGVRAESSDNRVGKLPQSVTLRSESTSTIAEIHGERLGSAELTFAITPTARFGGKIQNGLIKLSRCFGLGFAKISVAVTPCPLLVVAPHPDDETLMAAGIIARARAAGEPVKVVVVTNGDDKRNQPEYGLKREAESAQAMLLLGLDADDLIFLGYAGATGELLYLMNSYLSEKNSYTSQSGVSSTYAAYGLGERDYHSWLTGNPAAYNGMNLLHDLETLLKAFRPVQIYTSSRFDEHPEHRAVYYFLVRAVQSVRLEDPAYSPVLHTAVVHDVTANAYPDFWESDSALPQIKIDFSGDDCWPRPNKGVAQDAGGAMLPSFTPPPNLWRTSLDWSQVKRFPVPEEMHTAELEKNLKYRALRKYASQPLRYLAPFCKQDEIFWREELGRSDLLVIAPLMLMLAEGEASLLTVALLRPATAPTPIAIESRDESVVRLPSAVLIRTGSTIATFPVKAVTPGETVITARLDVSVTLATVIVVEAAQVESQGRPVFLS